jgi:5-(carboxyamino)imidazole ribonucleotide synthase
MALPAGSTIGILGGGQLGRMLAIAAAKLGCRTIIFDPDPKAPAAQLANDHVVADYGDRDALEAFARRCDVVTFEFENVPVHAARIIDALTPVKPGTQALESAQDRLVEKTFLNSIGIETAPFRAVDSDQDLAEALSGFGGSGVLKTRRMGYDGKGQRVFRDAPAASTAGIYASFGSVPLILEGLVAFQREVSLIAARDGEGIVKAFDPAENVHRGGILHTSTIPAAISADTHHAVCKAASAILHALNYVGVMGVEFFVLEDGKVLANEMAPRVHNSGHWTEAACAVSQFDQHIRAIAGLPLGSPVRHSDCVMENLIGQDISLLAQLCAQPDVVVHHYGKTEARRGRKMGHFTRLTPMTP